MDFTVSHDGSTLRKLQNALIKALQLQWDTNLQWWQLIGISFVSEEKQNSWNRARDEARANWLLRQLENSMEPVPGHICKLVELPSGSTFAALVMNLQAELDLHEHISSELGSDPDAQIR
jgi:hypothetical protein